MRKLIEYISADNIRRITAVFLLLSLAVMYPGLFPSREVAFFPAFDSLMVTPDLNIASIILILGAILYLLIRPSRFSGMVLLVAGVCFISMDLNRFHPLMLNVIIVMLIPRDGTREDLRKLLIGMLLITYLFIAVNRINPTYFISFELILLWFQKGNEYMKPITIAITALQGLIVISLVLIPNRHKLGAALSGFMALITLTLMAIVGIDPQSILWNSFLVVFSFILFILPAEIEEEYSFIHKVNFHAGTIIVFLIAVLGFVGVINKSFSYCTYSGRAESGLVLVQVEKIGFLPENFKTGLVYLDSNPIIDLGYMMGVSYGQTLYPDKRNIKRMVLPLRNVSFENTDLVLLLRVGDDLTIGKGIEPYLKSEF